MLRRILSYMGPYKKYAFGAILCVVTETMFELIIPLIMADIVDVGIAMGDRAYIFQRGALMSVCAGAALVLGVASARLSALCGQGLGAELRKAAYRRMQGFSFGNIDRFGTPSLVTRLTSDVTAIQNSVSNGMRPAFRAPTMMLTATIVSFTINAKLALVFLAAMPLLGVLLFEIIRRVRPLYTLMQSSVDQVNRIIRENLTAIRVVKAYVRGDYETEKFSAGNRALQTASEKAFGLSALNMPAMQLVMYATILAILWFGGGMVRAGGMRVGELTGFLSYVLQVLNSLMMISNVFMMMTRSLASGRRILEIIDEAPEITDRDASPGCTVSRGEITFDHVWFKYRQQAAEFALSDISFTIGAGRTVGVIGRTGSAKTTLVQLIPRLYDASRGEVRIDGLPVKSYPLRHLRDAIAVVLQKNTLFSGTVRDNLRWGRQDATDEEIAEACRIACADEFIERLADGYDTELGQGGVNVSGGQKQRLCIARAILKRPKVLILDDSTSAVDMATEARIRQRLAESLPGMTKIIIAQRVSSVIHADKIIIMEEGRILAEGTHASLLADNAVYQEIYQSQREGAGL